MTPPLKGLLIGCGFFSRNHLHAWTNVEGAAITAVCDLDADRARTCSEDFNIAAWHTNASIMASDKFDFVDICRSSCKNP
jgi:predicted dehydrogenase